MTKVYQELAMRVQALETCSSDWVSDHEEAIENIINKYLPSGSGINSDIIFDHDTSYRDRLVFSSWYHPIKGGMYTEPMRFWIGVTPSFVGEIDVEATVAANSCDAMSDSDALAEYLAELFRDALCQEIE